MSMSGGSLRSALMKRPNSSVARCGSTAVTPRQIADQRIGRAAAPLAQDVLRARPMHDVGHGEEVRLVLKLLDQCQLFVQRGAVLRGHALRKAPQHALLGQIAQPARGRVAGGHDLFAGIRSAARPAKTRSWPAMCSVAASASAGYRAASRRRERRCASALGCSARPHSATGLFSRVAVSTSCSGLRERACISTSPAATRLQARAVRHALQQHRPAPHRARGAAAPAR